LSRGRLPASVHADHSLFDGENAYVHLGVNEQLGIESLCA
jgi:hypothetical protein